MDPPIEIGDPLEWDFREAGPFRVGYRSFEHVYTPAGQTEPRTLVMHVWYPTLDEEGEASQYMVVRDRESFGDASLAAPAHAGGKYPLHVFSHGHRGFGGVASNLHRRFASHGWVTIAPDHTGNTLSDNVDPRPVALYYERSLDVSEAIDALDELDASDPLAGVVDTSTVLLTGHSFGTHTVWSSAGATFDVDAIEAGRCTEETPCTEEELEVFRGGLRDERFVAAIPMAGAISADWFGASGEDSVEIPLFAMSGGDDPVGADVQFERTEGLDFRWIDVAGACHEFFGLASCGTTLDKDDSALIVGSYALAMGRRYVLGDEAELTTDVLDGVVEISDLVTFMKR